MTALLAIHLAATYFMVGLIWTVQVVHYPLFHFVGSPGFPAYEAAHTRRIGTLLLLPAVVEIVTAGAVFATKPSFLTFAAGAVLAGIWAMTALVHAPLHGRLASGYREETVSGLVSANWWRTVAWSVRGVLAIAILLGA